jgi:hypothetical protein
MDQMQDLPWQPVWPVFGRCVDDQLSQVRATSRQLRIGNGNIYFVSSSLGQLITTTGGCAWCCSGITTRKR